MSDKNFSDVFDDESFQIYLDYVKNKSTVNYYDGMELSNTQAGEVMTGQFAFTEIAKVFLPNCSQIELGAFYEANSLSDVFLTHRSSYYWSEARINAYAFCHCDNLEKVEAHYYWYIGKKAFADCIKLSSVNADLFIYAGNIDDAAFKNCYNLKTPVQFYSSNISSFMSVYIGDEAFMNCYNISILNIIKDPLYIGKRAFKNCEKLSSISTIFTGNSSIIINDEAFYNTAATIINMSKTYYVGNKCFANCKSLSIAYVNGCSFIGDSIFENCYNLFVLDMRDLTYIRNGAFKNLKKLSYIYFDKVNDIGEEAFLNCESLSQISFSNCVEISSTTFKGCSNINTINIPLLQSLPDKTFGNFDPNNGYGMSVISNLALYNCEYIGAWNFYSCYSITGFNIDGSEIKIPQVIGRHAFGYCTSLTGFALSNNVYRIEEYAFSNCYSLQHFATNTCQFIDSHAFEYCSELSVVAMRACCLSIGEYAFQGCSKLSQIQLSNCKSIGEHAFDGCSPSLIFVPHLPSFPEGFSENGNKFKNLQVLNIDSMFKISANYFSNISTLTYVAAYNVSIIENNAFKNCVNLQALGMSKISFVAMLLSTDAFDGCSLNSSFIRVPSSLYNAYITAPVWSELANYIKGV